VPVSEPVQQIQQATLRKRLLQEVHGACLHKICRALWRNTVTGKNPRYVVPRTAVKYFNGLAPGYAGFTDNCCNFVFLQLLAQVIQPSDDSTATQTLQQPA
jgi:hypothetical protein